MSHHIVPSAAGNIRYPTNSTLFCQKVLKGQTIGKNHTSQGNSSGPKSTKASNRIHPTTSFYLPVDGACLLTRYLRSSTGSQVYNVLLLQPVGFLGIKSLSGQCTQLDIPWSLTAVGEWLKLLYTCPSILVTIGLWRILFPGFKKNLIPGLYLGRNFSFLCSSSGTQQWTCPRLIIYLRAWFMSLSSRMSLVSKNLP